MTLLEQIASKAEFIVNNLEQTDYQHMKILMSPLASTIAIAMALRALFWITLYLFITN